MEISELQGRLEDEALKLQRKDWSLFIPEDLEDYMADRIKRSHPYLYETTTTEEMYRTIRAVLAERKQAVGLPA